MTVILASALAGLSILLVVPRPNRWERSAPTFKNVVGLGLVVASGAAALVLVRLDVSAVLVGVFLGVGLALARAIRRRQARRAADRRRTQVLAACEALAADLAAGLAPDRALRAMADGWPELRPVADAAAVGADVPAAFRTAAESPGADMLRVTAAAWSVAHRSGAGLAEALALAADTLRAQRVTARIVATELSAALATARLLALLPVGILFLGRGMGGDPFAFLFRSTAGQLCLTIGLGLSWAGSMWLERIAEDVGRP